MSFDLILLEAFILITSFCSQCVNSQLYNQNGTTLPYPYQTALGLPPGQGLGIPGPQNSGIQPAGGPSPYPHVGMTPNISPNYNNYYAMLAQQGRPAYPLAYPQPGPGYPQPAVYPPTGSGYPLHSYGYPQMYQPAGGYGYPYPGINQGSGAYYYPAVPQPDQGTGQQQYQYGGVPDQYANIKTEIIDVSPEYHRQVLGWPSESTPRGENSGDIGGTTQETENTRPRHNVKTDSKTSNLTYISSNLTQPIIATKKFTTSIRRTFVCDSSKPGQRQTINLNFVNGELVTTTEPPTTTENSKGSGVTIKGRRFMDVPASCPKGTLVDNKGNCISPFVSARLGISKNETTETTSVSLNDTATQAPEQDPDEI